MEGTEDHKQAASLLQRSSGQLHPERTLLSRVGHAGTPHGCALEQQAGAAAKPLTALGPLACQLLQPIRRGKEESRNVRLRLLPLPSPSPAATVGAPPPGAKVAPSRVPLNPAELEPRDRVVDVRGSERKKLNRAPFGALGITSLGSRRNLVPLARTHASSASASFVGCL